MFAGMPSLFRFSSGLLVEWPQTTNTQALTVNIFREMGDVLNSMRFALSACFPLRLDVARLQTTSFDSPYEKWASIVGDHFWVVDAAVRNHLKNVLRYYDEAMIEFDPWEHVSMIGASRCLPYMAAHFRSCVIDSAAPRLTVSAIHFDQCLRDGLRFRESWVEAGHPKTPEVLSRSTFDIRDRSQIDILHADGLRVVDELTEIYDALAQALSTRLTIHDILTRHDTRPEIEFAWWILVEAERLRRERKPENSIGSGGPDRP